MKSQIGINTSVIKTRPAGQAAELSQALQALGINVIEIPMVEIIPEIINLEKLSVFLSANGSVNVSDSNGLDDPLSAEHYKGIFFSSPNGIEYFGKLLTPAQLAKWSDKPVYLIGPKAKAQAAALGFKKFWIPQNPKNYSLNGFLTELHRFSDLQIWLHPCSSITQVVPLEFQFLNVNIQNLSVYRPDCPKDNQSRIVSLSETLSKSEPLEKISGIVFCSSSAVTNFSNCVTGSLREAWLKGSCISISMGASTSRTLQSLHIKTILEAKTASVEGLVQAFINWHEILT